MADLVPAAVKRPCDPLGGCVGATYLDWQDRAVAAERELAAARDQPGVVLDKDAVRLVLQHLTDPAGGWFTAGPLGIEQATNRICSLQRPPRSVEDVALTVGCDYCGRTAGNRCHRGHTDVPPHPSRIRRALRGDA